MLRKNLHYLKSGIKLSNKKSIIHEIYENDVEKRLKVYFAVISNILELLFR